MTIQRYEYNTNHGMVDDTNGSYVDIDDLVKFLHEQIKISDTNRKAYDEECNGLKSHTDEFRFAMLESMKSESELNAFILVLQALGKNPIKESK